MCIHYTASYSRPKLFKHQTIELIINFCSVLKRRNLKILVFQFPCAECQDIFSVPDCPFVRFPVRLSVNFKYFFPKQVLFQQNFKKACLKNWLSSSSQNEKIRQSLFNDEIIIYFKKEKKRKNILNNKITNSIKTFTCMDYKTYQVCSNQVLVILILVFYLESIEPYLYFVLKRHWT